MIDPSEESLILIPTAEPDIFVIDPETGEKVPYESPMLSPGAE